MKGAVKPYAHMAAELTVQNDLLKGSRIVIPSSLHLEMLDKLHTGHQGITKCRERARQSVWWPGLNKHLEKFVGNCHECCKHRLQYAEPLMLSTFPDIPWQKVAANLFDWKGHTYFSVIDYFSRYISVAMLSAETSSEIIRHMKSIFGWHGIPEEVFFNSDSGPQFPSSLFHKFAEEYGFYAYHKQPKVPPMQRRGLKCCEDNQTFSRDVC